MRLALPCREADAQPLCDDGAGSCGHAGVALSALAEFPLHRYAHEFMLPRIWELRANSKGRRADGASVCLRVRPAGQMIGTAIVLRVGRGYYSARGSSTVGT